ncbi:MAG: ERF family protein, partial [Gammaproteobacteria bacterium]
RSGSRLRCVDLEVAFTFYGPAGDSVTAVAWGEGTDTMDKATNKAMSAAYKYAAFQAFAIPTEGDNDADAHTHAVAPRQQKVATVSEKQAADIQALIEEVGADKVEFLAWVAKVSGLPVKTVNDIPAADVEPITKALERKRNTAREHA